MGQAMSTGGLIFFCGKMGAGKTTKSREMAQTGNAVLISEDDWLAALYPDRIASLPDYIEYSALLRPPMKRLVQSILSTGTDVVMDFPANTVQQRKWFRSIYSEIGATHNLIYIELPDEVCIKRITTRRVEQPDRSATDTVEMFERVTEYFVAPSPDEGFNMTVVGNA